MTAPREGLRTRLAAEVRGARPRQRLSSGRVRSPHLSVIGVLSVMDAQPAAEAQVAGLPDATVLTPVVALDGPGGSGKSTVAAGLATRLGWQHLDTGAMYRAVTLAALRRLH